MIHYDRFADASRQDRRFRAVHSFLIIVVCLACSSTLYADLLPPNYDGGVSTTKVFSQGDNNGNGSDDIDDAMALIGEYDGVMAMAETFGPAAGELELIVDVTTGAIKIVANNGSICAFQIASFGGCLVAADATPDVLTLILGNDPTRLYAEMAYSDMAVDGDYALDLGFNTAMNVNDIEFKYGVAGGTAITGTVAYVPEPATMALLGLGGLVMIRRRRAA